MVDDLITDKLVENRKSLTMLTLDSKEFTINGIKQTDALQQKYAAKYLKDKSGRMQFNFRY
jgi:hypothetical protein